MIDKTFEELGEFRDETGYINMDAVLEKDTETIREVRGNENREKDWITIKDGTILIKTNALGQCNAEYSELICDELAKQAGLEVAEYDMVKYKGETGLITKNICGPGEEMISVYELIGMGPDNPDHPDKLDINYVFETLPEKLAQEGLTQEQIDICMVDMRKQLLFDLCVMETDRHTQNLSFIKSKVDGKPAMRLAPMYDTENALVLYENDPQYMQKIYSSILSTSKTVAMQEPKITIMPEKEEEVAQSPMDFLMKLRGNVKSASKQLYVNDSEEMWKRTFDFLCEDERAKEYWQTTLSRLSINDAIKEVETRIGTSMPEHIKQMVTACFYERKDAMNYHIPATEPRVSETKDRKKIIDEDII